MHLTSIGHWYYYRVRSCVPVLGTCLEKKYTQALANNRFCLVIISKFDTKWIRSSIYFVFDFVMMILRKFWKNYFCVSQESCREEIHFILSYNSLDVRNRQLARNIDLCGTVVSQICSAIWTHFSRYVYVHRLWLRTSIFFLLC